MAKISVKPPSGFRDFSPSESSARSALMQKISEIYQNFGYQAIDTPACENLELLLGKGGGQENEKLIFKLLKRGDALKRSLENINDSNLDQLSDSGLRFDLTVSLARYYARHQNNLSRPFKSYHIGRVWRAERPQKGRYRELIQCDLDTIGSAGIGVEIDTIAAIMTIFHTLGLEDCEVHINDRRLLDKMGCHFAIEPSIWQEVLITLDKLDKIGFSGVEEELQQKIDAKKAKEIIASLQDENFAWSTIDPESVQHLQEIQQILKPSLDKQAQKIIFNPTLVRGQDYYTGTIFEFRNPNFSSSIGGGGRYDRLLELFGGRSTAACGASIGFERLFLLLQEQKKLDKYQKQLQVFFPCFSKSPEILQKCFELAQALREKNIACDVYPAASKLQQQFRYANDKQIPFIASLGEDEFKNNTISIKKMDEDKSESIALSKFVQRMEDLCRN